MRRTVLLLASTALALLLSCGVAFTQEAWNLIYCEPGATWSCQGTEEDDLIFGTPGWDFVMANGGNDDVYGEEYGDDLQGNYGDDYLNGMDGNDTLSGDSGTDYLRGGAGNDGIWGGTEADKLYGDKGRDQLTGESGDDVIKTGTDTRGDRVRDSVFCGPGTDKVLFEKGIDSVDRACEIKRTY